MLILDAELESSKLKEGVSGMKIVCALAPLPNTKAQCV